MIISKEKTTKIKIINKDMSILALRNSKYLKYFIICGCRNLINIIKDKMMI